MKFHTEYLTFQTAKRREYINITPRVEEAVRKSGAREGMVLVSAMHITAAVYVNDAEDGLIADIDEWLEHLAPFREDYRHHRTGEDNGDAHLKNLTAWPWWVAALASWGIALFEYLLQVPANRIGYTVLSLPQLKIMQEAITLAVFVPFAIFYMRQPIKLDYLWASLCILGAVYFIFRG